MPAETQSRDEQDLEDDSIWTDVPFRNAPWVMADLTGTSLLRDGS